MASITDPRSGNVSINYNEPPRRSAPLLTVGPIAWVRQNLFRTVFDTILTLVFTALVIGGIVSLLRWSIVEANWFVITRNLRLFMLGSFQPEYQWRVEIAVLLTTFVVGFSLAAWARLSRIIGILLIIVAALILIIPPLAYTTTSPPRSYLAVGSTPVASGTVTETPLSALGFIGRGGETISIQVAVTDGSEDATLMNIAGFTDRATEAIVNGARNRITTDTLIADITAQLANPVNLTEAQRERLQDELSTLETARIPESITETYTLNQQPVTLQLLDGTTFEVIAETTLSSQDGAWSVQLPADGWYILNKTVEGEGVTLLQTTGIYPILERITSLALAGGGSTQVSEYLRISDELKVAGAQPEIDNVPVPFMGIIDNHYKGDRSFNDWLRLHVAPFLEWSGRLILPLMVVATLGYFAARAVNILPANAEARNWKIPQIPLFTFSSLRSRLPASLSNVLRNVIAVVIFLILLIPFLVIWLINLVIAFLVREVQGFVLAKNKAAFIATRLWMILPIIFWVLVAGIGVASMPFTDVSRWGGLLLTMILAAVGIVVSFPLGVLLALGRRSDMPVVRGVSTVYIEMVRGVPLITVLFMAQLLVPLINPDLAEVESIYRAMVGITLFSAAYLAENVRGGLQAVPPGQEEAAKALGLNPVLVLWFITLPQALRLVIPALVGQFISLFKDTSLVAIVGLIDFTGVARNVTGQTEFNGLQTETYVFLALIYFTFCYTMGVISRRIEASGSGAARRI